MKQKTIWMIIFRPIIITLFLLVAVTYLNGEGSVSQAQSPSRLQACGSRIDFTLPVEDEVSYPGECRYRFTGVTGTTITIELDAAYGSSLDPMLDLLDPTGAVEAFNDNRSAINTNSLISNHRLLRSGSYTVVVQPAKINNGGGFILTLTKIR